MRSILLAVDWISSMGMYSPSSADSCAMTSLKKYWNCTVSTPNRKNPLW